MLTTIDMIIKSLPAIVMLIIFFWGMKRIYRALASDVTDTNAASALASALSETADVQDGKTSFSRTAGAIGALAMASFFAGLGVWVLLSIGTVGNVGDSLKGLSQYFLSGTALYAPYAVNRISGAVSSFAKTTIS